MKLNFTMFKLAMDTIDETVDNAVLIMLLETCMSDWHALIKRWIDSPESRVKYSDRYGTIFTITSLPGLFEALNHYDL